MTPLERCIAAFKQPGQPQPFYAALDQAVKDTLGHILFTLLYRTPDGKRVRRIYTNMPKAYPVGGFKEVAATPWNTHVIEGQRAYVGYTATDIRWAFFDHELIKSLGCDSVINMPVIYDGRVLGTMNLLAAEQHYSEADVPRLEPFAALLAAPFLQAIDADPDKPG
ncbi:MAG: GAF domain-containing protein [Alphaproteobacteria bacterium]|nr:GAF domain-containing protein [Alphaproteobacteria bacterium]